MSYSIRILRRAQKALARLPKRDYERVRDAIRALAKDPRPPGSRKLTDREGWRIRIGVYRVIYDIDDGIRVVTVVDVGHRGDVYR
jgi:mRNA interferase RelE/StbE